MGAELATKIISVLELCEGDTAVVAGLSGVPETCRQLMEMGFTPGSHVTLMARGPFRDPIALSVRGTIISLRLKEAQCLSLLVQM
jgi:ferrous iron transport protein A